MSSSPGLLAVLDVLKAINILLPRMLTLPVAGMENLVLRNSIYSAAPRTISDQLYLTRCGNPLNLEASLLP